MIINDHILNTFCLLRSWSLSWHLRPCSGILPTEEIESTLLWLLVKRNKATCFLSFVLCSPTITIACYWSTITRWFFLHWPHLNVNSGLVWNLKDCHVLRDDESEVCAATVCTSSPSLWDGEVSRCWTHLCVRLNAYFLNTHSEATSVQLSYQRSFQVNLHYLRRCLWVLKELALLAELHYCQLL